MGKESVIQRRNNAQNPYCSPAKPANQAATKPAAALPPQPNGLKKSPPAPVQTTPTHPTRRSRKDDLPAAYGENRLVVMPVAPDRVHLYWELDPAAGLAKGEAAATQRKNDLQVILRLHCAAGTRTSGERDSSPRFLDLKVAPEAHKCYVSLPAPEQTVSAELGLQTEGGRFFPLLQSNRVITPALHPAARADETEPTAGEAESLAQFTDRATQLSLGETADKLRRGSVPVPEELVRRRIAEFYALVYKPHPLHAAAALAFPDSASPFPHRAAVDLTALSEQRLAPGTSSWMAAASPAPASSDDH